MVLCERSAVIGGLVPVVSDMLLSLISLAPAKPRPSELDFFLSLLHHFQSGWALKWASFTWNRGRERERERERERKREGGEGRGEREREREGEGVERRE